MADDPQEVCSSSPLRTAPRVAAFVGDDIVTYFLFIEEKIIFKITCSFTKILMLWFVSHYIFNLEYCKHARDVALFVQEFVFGLPEMSKNKGATYLTVATDINKFVEN